jgi:hypothetical protein
MRSRITAATRRLGLAAGALLLATVPASAQELTLQVKQSTAWGTSLTIPVLQVMSFQWKWTGMKPPSGGVWQLSTATTPPTGVDLRAGSLAKQLALQTMPKQGEYSPFTIAPSVNLPDNLPSKFHVRIRVDWHGGGSSVSSWIPILVAQRAQTAFNPPPTLNAPGVTIPDKPFLIPGGADTDYPLTVRLKKIYCREETSDGSDADEVYAFLHSTYLNRQSPFAGLTRATRVYENFDEGDSLKVDVAAWGPMDLPHPISKPENAIVLVALMENDVDVDSVDRKAAAQSITRGLRSVLDTLPATATTAQFVAAMKSRMATDILGTVGFPKPLFPDVDERIGTVQQLVLTSNDVEAAEDGQLVKKSLWFKAGPDDDDGEYRLDFEISRVTTVYTQGVPQEPATTQGVPTR